MAYKDEIARLTTDLGARRIAEICDELEKQLNSCCGKKGIEPDTTAAQPPAVHHSTGKSSKK